MNRERHYGTVRSLVTSKQGSNKITPSPDPGGVSAKDRDAQLTPSSSGSKDSKKAK